MEIREKLRHLRTIKGYTQEYVAEKLGIDAVNYGRIERGESKLTLERLKNVLEIFGVSFSDFFKDIDNNQTLNGDKNEEILEFLKKIYLEVAEINQKLNNHKAEDSENPI
jgi:transcriptional regulator with XRE-family HTH domain